MIASALRCTNCRKRYPLRLAYHCPSCHFPLEVAYVPVESHERPQDEAGSGVWRFGESLPLREAAHRTTLGEGDTPLLPAARLGRSLGLSRLYVKNEGNNPTGSFKDRPSAVGVSMAAEMGVDTVVASSTGNAGVSLAAYAARAGLRAVVTASEGAQSQKLAPISSYGASIVRVRGTVSDAYHLACEAAQKWGWMNLTSTFLNPFTVEGDKTVAYELFDQLQDVPDFIVVPVSVGPLLVGIFRGFVELREAGIVQRIPRLVAAQASRCAPIAYAFEMGSDDVEPWQGDTDTVAGGIADPLDGYEQDGTYTLRVVKESNGTAVACDDDEILAAGRSLASQEGIHGEPTGVVSIAAVEKLARLAALPSDALIVAVVTGSGLKEPLSLSSLRATSAPPIGPTLEELDAALSRIKEYVR